jgi:TonB family C-terminal domain
MRFWRALICFIALLVLVFSLSTGINAEEKIRQAGDGVTAPKLIYKIQPKYTKRAKKAKLHGVVRLRIVVASTGIPEDIKVTKGLDQDLDVEAIKAVSQWRFEPAMENGKAVPVWADVEVSFRLCCRW